MTPGPGSRREGFLAAGGLRLHFVEWGDADAPALVLLHGLGDCARTWDGLAAALSAEYRVVALDHRGHGESQWARPQSYSARNFVSDVEALVDEVVPGRMVLVGHAEGGCHAITYAARHGERLAALVAVESDVEGGSLPLSGLPGLPEVEEPGMLEAVVERLRRLQPRASDDALRHQASHLADAAPGGVVLWKADPKAVERYQGSRLWSELARVDCPTLVVRGRQSDVLGHETVVRMREALPNARLAEMEGGGHWYHQEEPEAFEATVRWFLQPTPS
jgi:pimeloyl-ACP methyl ester carboxylesterase